MDSLVGQLNDDEQIAPTDTLGAGPVDSDAPPPTDTLPPSSPPPAQENEEENPTVVPSSTVSPELVLEASVVAQDDKEGGDPPPSTVHTSDLNPDEMLLDTVDPGSVSVDGAGGQVEDGQEWIPEHEQEMKRVKVYELVGQRWVDQGTAFCFGQFHSDGEHALLIARSERNYSDIILSTPIRSTDVYQRQQETLIVWTEPNGADYALSFQDPEGCSEHHLAAQDERTIVSSSPVVGPEPAGYHGGGRLPTPQLGIIGDIERTIKGLSRPGQVKDRLIEYIMGEEYFKGLIDVLHTAEDLESIENLHALCSLTQTILMLNDHNLYEHILSDDLFPGIVGMLEYDPEFPSHKANYREFLSQTSQFHEPIPLHDPTMQRKVHHTYRLQFLKDVVLARALDDSTFNVLNSCIIFNQIDIITHVQADPSFLWEIVVLFVAEDALVNLFPRRATPPQAQSALNGLTDAKPNELPATNGVTAQSAASTRRDGWYKFAPPDDLSEEEIRLRQQVSFWCNNFVLWAKTPRGAICRCMPRGRCLQALLDHDAGGVRTFVLKQVAWLEQERDVKAKGADKAETLMALLCRLLAKSGDLAVQSQIGDAMKVLLDTPPAGEMGATGPATEAAPGGIRNLRRDDINTERFLDYYYKEPVHLVFQPIIDLPEWKKQTDPLLPLTREETNRFTYLCDIVYNCISGHNFRGYFYVASSGILSRVPTLFKARDKHLQHAAFRIFRMLLRLNNANVQAQLMKLDVFKPILDLTYLESRRDNLLSCSCHEYFDFMKRENMKDLIKFCMTRHEGDIRKLIETPLGRERFTLFVKRWEMNNEPPPEESKQEKPPDSRWPGQGRAQDAEEEDYFNADDDNDDYIPPISQQQWVRSLPGAGRGGSPLPSLKRKRRVSAMGAALGAFQPNLTPPRSPSPSLGQLMDYGDDDEDLGAIDAELRLATTAQESSDPPPLPLKRAADDDDEDNMLEALVRGKTPSSRPPTPGPPRAGDKRRRSEGEEEEDDEMLERLTKAKKPDLGAQKGGAAAVVKATKLGDDPPLKKLKLKFGLGSAVLASSTDSKNGAKDGDTG
ncbi:component of IIS longevity pathway SMK-1-domain-containing protein [Roridomyces roridus]|uniref:Component of IIS longevity pathway SMK-1-domain-containing protein n=1 Tax=Roridomyces roridus TaxID=1738132 RepID=A0AAD7C5R6_9AGAR|nr:component of IIS longevity pathway SMK-1-domain-containing protein [Roridomyces roridus]